MLTFILGGARSGKSAMAQRMAHERGGDAVLYLATYRPSADHNDAEMQRRIAKHRADRPNTWPTAIIDAAPAPSIAAAIRQHRPRVLLLDCLSMLVSGALFMGDDLPTDPEAEATQVVEAMLQTYAESDCEWVVVSNEVGLSLVPEHPASRAYRDALGRANQVLARAADAVYFVIAGLPQRLR